MNDWTKPAYCEATTKFFRLQQAQEEILQLNVEIWWLYTAIHDEKIAVLTAIRFFFDQLRPPPSFRNEEVVAGTCSGQWSSPPLSHANSRTSRLFRGA